MYSEPRFGSMKRANQMPVPMAVLCTAMAHR